MKEIKSIEEIIYDYDNFIIDQWGVMHDGTFGYDHAFNTINILNSNNKNLFIISNSSKRSKSSITIKKFFLIFEIAVSSFNKGTSISESLLIFVSVNIFFLVIAKSFLHLSLYLKKNFS